MQAKILDSVHQGIKAVQQLQNSSSLDFMENVSNLLADCFRQGHKVLIAGNGGSLCDATHFAEELTGIFRKVRRPLPVIPLSDPGHLTCTGNDLGFEWIFARAIEAYGQREDVFIGLTTSGNSPNIIKAFETAEQLGLKTVALLGKSGGKLKGVADYELIIEGFTTSDRIQEAHMTAMHIIIEMLEYLLFPEQTDPAEMLSRQAILVKN